MSCKLGPKWAWLAFRLEELQFLIAFLNGLGSLGGGFTLFLAVCLVHRPGFVCLYGGSGNVLDFFVSWALKES